MSEKAENDFTQPWVGSSPEQTKQNEGHEDGLDFIQPWAKTPKKITQTGAKNILWTFLQPWMLKK